MGTVTKPEGPATPWNKGKLLGQKPPLKLKEIWAIRIRRQLDHRNRDLALFNLAIDSKLRGCDLVGVIRRTAEGLSTKEIQRCLKRYIVRELYPLILADLADSLRES